MTLEAAALHGSCVARDGAGVLLLGSPGSGKSDLALRLIGRGFILVGDDQLIVSAGIIRSAPALAGLLEVRGLGILRLPFQPQARLTLVVRLAEPERLPSPERHETGAPVIAINPFAASAPDIVALALDCALGRLQQVVGAFVSAGGQ